VKNLGGELWTERLKSSHSPFLSHVDETVAWIRTVAGEASVVVLNHTD
jgi:predicted N-formylglutamate amidohydrolase